MQFWLLLSIITIIITIIIIIIIIIITMTCFTTTLVCATVVVETGVSGAPKQSPTGGRGADGVEEKT